MTDQDSRPPLPPPLPAEPIAPPPPIEPPFQGFPLDPWVRPRRVQRPLLGVSLWCFGALFWSYLVVGEIVVWTAVPEALGVLAVLGAFGVAWYHGTSQMPHAPLWRILLPGIIAFVLWLVTLVMSTAVFNTGGRKNAELAALLLWSFAASAYALGRHLTALNGVSLSTPARAGRIACWLIAALATLMAGINIISYS
jgi:hypothetical protein